MQVHIGTGVPCTTAEAIIIATACYTKFAVEPFANQINAISFQLPRVDFMEGRLEGCLGCVRDRFARRFHCLSAIQARVRI